nr:ABC transporter ATP-binding protein [uncultured Roseococcus sp.]
MSKIEKGSIMLTPAAPLSTGIQHPRPRIEAIELSKIFRTDVGARPVLDRISFSVGPRDRLAILGHNGAGKSTLIQILSGCLKPTSGEVVRTMTMSWPLALGSQFEGMLTGYDNVRFISKLYDQNYDEIIDFIEDFTELGSHLNIQTRFYSSGMQMRLAFALSLAIDFDCMLIDEVLMVGDARFQRKCHIELFEKRANKTMIMAVHSAPFVNEFCNLALVLKNGRGRVFEDVKFATRIYATL